MVLHISAVLKAGRLVKSKREWPLRIGFQGNFETQSCYIQLSEDLCGHQEEFLNDAVGGELLAPLGICQLESTGIFYINIPALSDCAPLEIGCNIPKEAKNTINALLQDHIAEQNGICGLCIWISSALCEVEVLERLLQIGYDENQTLCFLFAVLKEKKAEGRKETLIYGKLPDILLLNCLEFSNIKFQILLADKNQYQVAGIIKIQIEQYFLKFAGEFILNKNGYRLEFQCIAGMEDFSPIQIEQAKSNPKCAHIVLRVEHENETSQKKECNSIFLCTDITFAGVSTQGQLYFQDGKITFAEISLKSGFSFARLWDYMFPSSLWNENIFDLKFLDKSYFRYSVTKENKKEYQVQVFTELTIIEPLRLEGKMLITKENVKAELSLGQMIDLKIIKIKNLSLESGPSLVFQFDKENSQSEKNIEIKGAILFLDQTAQGTVSYIKGKNDWKIRMQLLLPEKIAALLGENITVLYSSKQGFQLENAETHLYQGENVDFIKQLEEFLEKKKGACESLKLPKNKKLHAKCKLKPSLSGNIETGKTFELNISGVIEFTEKEVLLRQEIQPDISLTLEPSSTFDSILKDFFSGLQKTLETLISELFSPEHIEQLKKILLILAEEQIEEYCKKLLCRKLVSEETAENLSKKKPGSGSEESSETGSSSGGSSGGTSAGAGVVSTTGGAFGGGSLLENLGTIFGGTIMISIIAGGDETEREDPIQKLSCPKFTGKIENAAVQLEIAAVPHAKGYEIDLIWFRDISERKDEFFSFDLHGSLPEISLLKIPVYGSVFLAVRALHEEKKLSSDWSEGNLLTKIDHIKLIRWANTAGYCLRDCYTMLKTHDMKLTMEEMIEAVLSEYGGLETKKTLAADCYKNGKSALECYVKISSAYSHVSSKEMVLCMYDGGYAEDEIVTVLLQEREGIEESELREMFIKLKDKEL